MPSPPFLDLYASNRRIETAFFARLRHLYRNSAFIGGKTVEDFEAAFAVEMQAPHCVAVASGTAALHLSMIAAGVGPGDEVIVPAFTFPGAAGPILQLRARPVFADVKAHDGTLDPESVAKAVTSKTRAILATHLFGHPADLGALRRITGRIAGKRIALIEDAAQAHGGSWRGKPLGSVGDFGCFSFYPTKNLGGIGDGGAILTRTRRDAERLRRLRDHGQSKRFHPEEAGFNARLDAVQALFLTLKLPTLAADNARRGALAAHYLRGLDIAASDAEGTRGLPAALTPNPAGASAWHAFVIKTPRRAALIRRLTERGIGHQIYYPAALPDLTAYRAFARGDTPVARELARSGLALPLHPALRARDVDAVLAALSA